MKSNPHAKTEIESIGQQLVDGDSREEIVVKALKECQAAVDAGQSIDRSAILERYPEIREELSACLDGLDLMRISTPGGTADSSDQIKKLVQQHVAPSATLGDFRIVRELGRGGMGIVYEAEQLSIGRNVALKVLPYAAMLDKRQVARFQNEARAAATLEHPHIVSVYFVGHERGVYYYAMRLISGKNLAEVICELQTGQQLSQVEPTSLIVSQLMDGKLSHRDERSDQRTAEADTLHDAVGGGATSVATEGGKGGKIYYESVAKLGRQIAGALDFAHGHGIVHRDVKPANVMLDSTGDAWITDFGLARIESDRGMTMTGDLVGTLRYMSPEQTLAKRITVDHRCDVYSLGATLYEMLTLRPLFDGADRAALLRQIAFDDPILPSKITANIPRDLETIILTSLQKNPADRYATAGEFADDLQRFLSHEPIRARRTPLPQRVRMWTRRHPAMVVSTVTIGAVSLASASILGFVVANHEREARIQQEVTTNEIQRALDDRQEALDTATANLQLANQERIRAEANLRIAVQAVEETYLDTIGEERLLRSGAAPSQVGERPTFTAEEYRTVKKGLAFYDQIARQNPASVHLRFESAKAFSRLALLQGALDENEPAQEAYQEAIARLEGLTQQEPDTSEYFVELARAYYQQAQLSRWWPDASRTFAEAIAAASRANDLSPNNVEALQLRGRAHLCQQETKLALSDFERVVALQPDSAEACFELSRAFDVFNDHDAEIKYLERSVDLEPTNSEYRSQLALKYKWNRKDRESAVAVIEPLVNSAKTPAGRLEYRTLVTGLLDDHESTIELAGQWIQLAPDSLIAHRARLRRTWVLAMMNPPSRTLKHA